MTKVLREAQDVALSDLAARAHLKTGLAGTKAEILKWMSGMSGFQTVAVLGAVFASARLGLR